MKITVYTLTTDTDHGTTTSVYPTREARDAAAWAFIQSCCDSQDPLEFATLRAEHDEPADAFAELCEAVGFMDSMSLDLHDVEIPDPAPALGFAVIFDEDDGDNEPIESFYEIFSTPAEAEKIFREAYPPGPRKHGYHLAINPRLVAILKPLEGYDAAPVSTETAGDDEDNPFNQNRFTNYYECDCGTEWQDNWSCECNDRCPQCNREIEPYKSEENEEV